MLLQKSEIDKENLSFRYV